MPVPTIEDVRPILQDFELRIRKVLLDAWKLDWLKVDEKHRTIFDKTTRANCVFSFAKQRALAEFGDDKQIQVVPNGRSVKFLFKGQVLVRLKKANRSGIGSNIPTQATLEFVHPQIPLFELPEIYNVEVCYSENELATDIQSIAAVCRRGSRKVWSYEIDQPPPANVIPLPTPKDDGNGPTPATAIPRQRIEKPTDDSGE
jgi:hypothetical protein